MSTAPHARQPSSDTICLDHQLGWKCVLYDDRVHAMEEVAQQIIKATQCSIEAAVATMMAAHNHGCAVVLSGTRSTCLHCAEVLEQIGLKTSLYR